MCGIHQISVVGKGDFSLDMIDDNRLCVQSSASAGSSVPHMAHGDISSAEKPKGLGKKHIIHKPFVFIIPEYSAIVHHNSAAFLASVLQSKQSVVRIGRHIASLFSVNAENAAFFSDFTHSVL